MKSWLFLLSSIALGQGVTLLSVTGPNTIPPGGVAVLNIVGGGISPAGTQFTLNIPTGVSSVSVTAGGVATTAGKTVQCSPFAQNKITCVISGLNQNVMVAGVQAVVRATFSPTATLGNKVFSLVNTVATTAGGSNLGIGTPLTINVAPILPAFPPLLLNLAYIGDYVSTVTPWVEAVCSLNGQFQSDGVTLQPCPSFQVQRSTTSGGPYTVVGTGPGGFSPVDVCSGASCFVDNTVSWGTTYYYVVSSGTQMSSELMAVLPTVTP